MSKGPYPSKKRSTGTHGGGDSIGSSNLDARDPRLVSNTQANREQRIRDELSGEAKKKAIAKVTLPKFSWDKKD